MSYSLQLRAFRPGFTFNRGFVEIYGTTPDGRLQMTAISVAEVKENEATVFGPPITLTKQDAQTLMNDLWDCGLRPDEGSGSAGSLAATERHLADMRKIVAKKLDTPL